MFMRVSLHPPHRAEVEVLARLRPVWGGLFFDTLVYGAAWLVVGFVLWKGRQSSVGRLILWTAGSVLIGVAITVGVAWGIAYRGDSLVDTSKAEATSHQFELWRVLVLKQRGQGALRVTSEWYDRDVGRSVSRGVSLLGQRISGPMVSSAMAMI